MLNLKNRRELIKSAKEMGYTGPITLEDLKKWWDDPETAIEVTDPKTNKQIKGADLDAIWAKAVGGSVASDEDTTKANRRADNARRVHQANATLDEDGGGNDDQPRFTEAKQYRLRAERKAYNRRAQGAFDPSGTQKSWRQAGCAFPDADMAEAFGSWARQAVSGVCKIDDYSEKSFDEDVCQKANITTTQTAGGATVPDDFVAQLIDLKEIYGVIRGLLGTFPMSRDVVILPRRTGGVTIYAPGEATAITESNPTVDNVQLTAFKMGAYTEVSNELLNDSAINFGDFVAREMAYAMAKSEDEVATIGDATSTYFHQTGMTTKIKALSGTIANIAGLIVGTGNAYSELVTSDFIKVIARAPAYVDREANVGWLCHRRFFYEVMVNLAVGTVGTAAPGGTSGMEIINGIPRPMFMGYPVFFSQAMPRVEGNSQVCCLFGAFRLGAKLGEVRGGMSIASSEHFKFSSDVMAFRATQRIAFNAHDMGNASSTEASRIPGPIVGLITAAS